MGQQPNIFLYLQEYIPQIDKHLSEYEFRRIPLGQWEKNRVTNWQGMRIDTKI